MTKKMKNLLLRIDSLFSRLPEQLAKPLIHDCAAIVTPGSLKKNMARQWIRALLSGKYRQTQGKLRKPGRHGGYCCLGVLCDVYPKGKWQHSGPVMEFLKGKWQHSGPVMEFLFDGGVFDNFLPDSVSERVGLNAPLQNALVDLNDNGATFPQIAGVIAVAAGLEKEFPVHASYVKAMELVKVGPSNFDNRRSNVILAAEYARSGLVVPPWL